MAPSFEALRYKGVNSCVLCCIRLFEIGGGSQKKASSLPQRSEALDIWQTEMEADDRGRISTSRRSISSSWTKLTYIYRSAEGG